ncbi:MAG: DUF1419 domain-containing protein [Cellvibrionaceae bacterium]
MGTDSSTDWKEISEERYEELLSVLPPEKWERGVFRMSEYTSGTITLHVVEMGGRFFEAEKPATSTYDEYLSEVSELIRDERS